MDAQFSLIISGMQDSLPVMTVDGGTGRLSAAAYQERAAADAAGSPVSL